MANRCPRTIHGYPTQHTTSIPLSNPILWSVDVLGLSMVIQPNIHLSPCPIQSTGLWMSQDYPWTSNSIYIYPTVQSNPLVCGYPRTIHGHPTQYTFIPLSHPIHWSVDVPGLSMDIQPNIHLSHCTIQSTGLYMSQDYPWTSSIYMYMYNYSGIL